MESKQQTTRPFWTSTCGGGWAYRQSASDRLQRCRANSRHTSSVSQPESFPDAVPPPPVSTRAVAGVADGADDFQHDGDVDVGDIITATDDVISGLRFARHESSPTYTETHVHHWLQSKILAWLLLLFLLLLAACAWAHQAQGCGP